jgi:hypothetical protein
MSAKFGEKSVKVSVKLVDVKLVESMVIGYRLGG